MTEEKIREMAAAIADAIASIASDPERGDLACCTTPPDQVLASGDRIPQRVCIALDLCSRQRPAAGPADRPARGRCC